MPRTALTVQTLKGPYPGTVSVNDLDITFAAADVANGNDFPYTGREVILMRNDDAGAQTVTFTSSAEPATKRLGHITDYSIGIGEYAAFWAGAIQGWVQAGQKFFIDASDANIMIAILRV